MAVMTDPFPQRGEWLAEEFERHRGHLRSVAYRMLGSLTEADDALQETWFRLQRGDPGGNDELRGWLTVTLSRICLDLLRKRRSRRETYAGTWLPEPIVTDVAPDGMPAGPERELVMADSVGIALLVVLDALSPAERLAFVLHDVFGVSFDVIGRIVDRTPGAARQLASRARRRVREEAPDPDADLPVQREAVDAFLAAARSGDFERLLRVLDPQVVFRADGGGAGGLSRPPVRGAEGVARQAHAFGPRFAGLFRPTIVNGGAGGIIEGIPGLPRIVVAFGVRAGRILSIDMNGDPAKTGESARPRVELRDVVTEADRHALLGLRLGPGQEEYLDSMEEIFEEAREEARAMPRQWSVHDRRSGKLVGFVMISDGIPEPIDDDLVGPYFLWKLLIDVEEQGKGFGAATIDAVVSYLRTRPGANVLYTSCADGPGSPRGFYLRYGFVDTGRVMWEENVLALDLATG
jgi:RNA polymerase sigma-70 factor (ECF subfamily)